MGSGEKEGGFFGDIIRRAASLLDCKHRQLGTAALSACLLPLVLSPPPLQASSFGRRLTQLAALYPDDFRRLMTKDDFRRFVGAGVLFCRDSESVPRKAAAAWLIGSRNLVMLNAHNFRDRSGAEVRAISDCFFQIGGRNYDFEADSLQYGAPATAPLHITDDWALVRLKSPVDGNAEPQPVPRPINLPTGPTIIKVTMVSPAGHANFAGVSSIESCEIRQIDPPSEDGIRRVRHNCNDGFGGSGSGLFDESGHLLAMQSASLDMNRKLAFDLSAHYGSALLIEGSLRDAVLAKTQVQP